nr:MAG TPA: hypothetical protein [Caudoviricetes sp.]
MKKRTKNWFQKFNSKSKTQFKKRNENFILKLKIISLIILSEL